MLPYGIKNSSRYNDVSNMGMSTIWIMLDNHW
jgi:hypothetical protein